ncbi:MAG: ComF family protein [bacterium]|nr:MAG: ComF family protein [bacterium]
MVRGFVSALIDQFASSLCVVCETEIERLPPVPVALPPGWPPETLAFFERDFVLPLLGGIMIPARVLCPSCWLTLEPSGGTAAFADTAGTPIQALQSAKRPSDGGGTSDRLDIPLVTPFVLNDQLLALIRFLKFSGGKTAVPSLGWWMAQSLARHLTRCVRPRRSKALLVPVPLHPSRQRKRGFNQAALLAREVAAALGLSVESDTLRRVRRTKPQSKLETSRRVENVSGAFGLDFPGPLEGRDLVLVDDIVTTGNTIGACIQALNGARPSSVVVLAAGSARDLQARSRRRACRL